MNSETKSLENQIENENENWKDTLDFRFVDELVDDLVKRYKNPEFRKWYCKLVYNIGPSRVNEIQGRVQGAQDEAKLFSKLANQELKRVLNKKKRRDG